MIPMPINVNSLVDLSAMPDAPVVPEPVARTRRSRIALAGLLERAAATIAPSEWSPAR
ncbi:MAG: hypothetical protein QOD68_3204 [Actinomycetota bacterium]|jgi:hypothetical protein|nr:hypothetical protein [Actinomycetota bacterium]